MDEIDTTAVLPPGDDHNRRLRDHVHPVNWSTQLSKEPYDLVAIGAGTAGLVSAAGAALLGARSALIERDSLGGDCLITGCVPSKTLIRSAAIAHAARKANEFGIKTGPVDVDFPAVMERVRRVRADIAHHDGAEGMRKRGVNVLFGTAQFTGPKTISLNGTTIPFRRAVICTGARPDVPQVPGLREHCLTSETFFQLTELPANLLVIGGGPIGCELAQAMARLGSQVTIIQRGDRLLPHDDPDAGRLIEETFRREMINLRFQTEPVCVNKVNNELKVDIHGPTGKETLTTNAILVATGRKPNVEGLGLDKAGIAFDENGVVVDRKQRTTNRRVFAAGDVCSPHKFTHMAFAQAEDACLNALLPAFFNSCKSVPCWTTFTDPEVAHAGKDWKLLHEMKDRIYTYTHAMSLNDRAQADGETKGFVRIHCKRGTDQIVAGTVVARHAGEMIAPLCLAITNGIGLHQIQKTVFPYPTFGEAIRKIAVDWKLSTLTPWKSRLLQYWHMGSRWWG